MSEVLGVQRQHDNSSGNAAGSKGGVSVSEHKLLGQWLRDHPEFQKQYGFHTTTSKSDQLHNGRQRSLSRKKDENKRTSRSGSMKSARSRHSSTKRSSSKGSQKSKGSRSSKRSGSSSRHRSKGKGRRSKGRGRGKGHQKSRQNSRGRTPAAISFPQARSS